MSEVEATKPPEQDKRPLPRWFLIIVAVAAGLVLLAMILLSFKLQPAPPRPASVTIEETNPPPLPLPPAPAPQAAAPKSAAPKSSARSAQAPVVAAAPKSDLITNPTWQRKPSGEELMSSYPGGALSQGIGGQVTLDCIVVSSGRLSCGVVSETPAGKGFGRAALSAAGGFKMAPTTPDGQPTYGRHIRIPMRFDPPKDG